jgi:hypothetical protein
MFGLMSAVMAKSKLVYPTTDSVILVARSNVSTRKISTFSVPNQELNLEVDEHLFRDVDTFNQQRNDLKPLPSDSKLRKLMSLRLISGPLFIAILFTALSIRTLSLLEHIGQDSLPTFTHMPSRAFTVLLLSANLIAGIGMLVRPSKAKVLGKLVFALNIVRESMGIAANLFSIVLLTIRHQEPEAHIALGQLLGNLFWASSLLSVSRTRWISPFSAHDPSRPESIKNDLGFR